MAGRFEGLSDSAWMTLEKLLPPPPKKRGKGMPPAPFRHVLNTIFYVLITGCRWCDIPEGAQWAKRSSSHRWLKRWEQDGTWEHIQQGIIAFADLCGQIDWTKGAVDGSFSPGRGGGAGVDIGYKGKGCTIHSLCDGNSRPLAIESTAANGDEREQVVPMLLSLPAAFLLLYADKGYDADWLRIACAWYCDTIAIISKRQWPKPKTPDPIQKNDRWVVERGHAWRQRKYRRTNIRWERLQSTWMGFLRASLIHYWITVLVG